MDAARPADVQKLSMAEIFWYFLRLGWLTFWKWRLNVVVVVLAGGALGLLRALVPGLFGGTLL